MDIADATSAYQTMLEGHRADPDNEELWEDLCKAAEALEVAYLEHRFDLPSAGLASNA